MSKKKEFTKVVQCNIMIIKKLIWDEWNIEHILRHHIEKEEVEEVFEGKYLLLRGRSGLYRIIGQSFDGRYLTIILAPREAGNFYPVTARDADNKERKRLKKNI